MKYTALVLEVLGIVAICSGIIIETIYKAHYGLVIITVGSLLIAIGGIVWAKIMPWRRY